MDIRTVLFAKNEHNQVVDWTTFSHSKKDHQPLS